MNGYVVLDSKNYAVVYEGYGEVMARMGAMRPRLDGKLDISTGDRYRNWRLVLRVYNIPVTGYGGLADIDATLLKRGIDAIISFTPSTGDARSVVVSDPEIALMSATPLLDGGSNYWLVPVTLQEIERTA